MYRAVARSVRYLQPSSATIFACWPARRCACPFGALLALSASLAGCGHVFSRTLVSAALVPDASRALGHATASVRSVRAIAGRRTFRACATTRADSGEGGDDSEPRLSPKAAKAWDRFQKSFRVDVEPALQHMWPVSLSRWQHAFHRMLFRQFSNYLDLHDADEEDQSLDDVVEGSKLAYQFFRDGLKDRDVLALANVCREPLFSKIKAFLEHERGPFFELDQITRVIPVRPLLIIHLEPSDASVPSLAVDESEPTPYPFQCTRYVYGSVTLRGVPLTSGIELRMRLMRSLLENQWMARGCLLVRCGPVPLSICHVLRCLPHAAQGLDVVLGTRERMPGGTVIADQLSSVRLLRDRTVPRSPWKLDAVEIPLNVRQRLRFTAFSTVLPPRDGPAAGAPPSSPSSPSSFAP